MRRIWLVGAVAGCMGPWVEPPPSQQGLADPSVGFVYVGPVGDHGWTLTHEIGRQGMNQALPDLVSHFEPSVLPVDAANVMEQFIAEGDNIIITTSFDFLSATQAVAANHPDVRFLNCSGFVSSPNLGSYFGRMYQAKYLSGLLAGSMTCTDKIGFVAPVTIPEVVRHVNAFALGVREVNPDAVVYVYWVDNWFDVEREPLGTNTLIALGTDVIITGTDTTIPLEVADGQTVTCEVGGEPVQTPVRTIGYDNPDSCNAAPDSCLTSAYWNWTPLYTRLVTEMIEGTWDPYEVVWEQMQSTPEQSTISLADIDSQVPASVRILVEEKIPDLVAPGGIHLPFVGEVRSTDGRIRVRAGEEISDEALLSMCWYVEGVRNAEDPDNAQARVPPGCGGVQ